MKEIKRDSYVRKEETESVKRKDWTYNVIVNLRPRTIKRRFLFK